ncbi:HalOD1 output domain-containing protein [Halomontanus rarus]|uniref:HalOD1 output domain-containing protein n=1 Tax=Halomontanus rarus TaxID=3034020 RepID=UPI001A97D8C3
MTERNGHDDRSQPPADSNGDNGDDEDETNGETTADPEPKQERETEGGTGTETETDPRLDTDRPTDSGTSRERNIESVSPETIPIDVLEALEHQYDLAPDESVVDAVLSVVATLQECEPLDLPPLYGAVDPNTLESIWSASAKTSAGTDRPRAVWCTFVLDRTLVTVTSAGAIYAVVLEDGEQD